MWPASVDHNRPVVRDIHDVGAPGAQDDRLLLPNDIRLLQVRKAAGLVRPLPQHLDGGHDGLFLEQERFAESGGP